MKFKKVGNREELKRKCEEERKKFRKQFGIGLEFIDLFVLSKISDALLEEILKEENFTQEVKKELEKYPQKIETCKIGVYRTTKAS